MEQLSRREKSIQYQRAYRKLHPEQIRRSNRAYYAENKEAIARRQKTRREQARFAGTGVILREHRRCLGLSQVNYAAALGISQAALSKWERGQVPVDLTAVETAFPGMGEKLKQTKEV